MTTGREQVAAGRRADRPGLDYLEKVFSLMYPGSPVALRRAPGGRHSVAWALVPTARNPSMLVPIGPRAASVASLDELSKRGRGRLERIARIVSRFGGLNLVPRLTVRRGGDDVQSVIARTLSHDDVALSMVIGRTRALQKPVLRVLSEDGATVGFAKIGISEVTRALVRHETEVLRGFEADPPRHFSAPSVLGAVDWGELTVLVQEPLRVGTRPDGEAVRRAAVEIAARGAVETRALADSRSWAELKARVTELPAAHPFTPGLARAVAHVDREWSRTPVLFGLWHGDFAEWNMTSDGAVLEVWDWEGCIGPVPAGFDLLHHRFQGDVVIGGRHPEAAFGDLLDTSSAVLSPWSPADPHLIVALYLIHLVTGLIETGDVETRISRLDDWLPSALQSIMDRRRSE
ncbi:hypothetical protein [Microbacterium sp. NPDC058345]|uniref:hypothetical protein n=1 Tax=Microbacterium sp. NPDC058345 TaxID=3346455 RepID=UPI0036476FA3